MNAISLGVISIIDDDESVRTSTRALLRSAGFEVESFSSAEDFLESGAISETACLILDIQMPVFGGLELQRRLKAAKLAVPIIFITAVDDEANRRTAIDAGAANFFCKPFSGDALLAAIQSALDGPLGGRVVGKRGLP